jgi:hypothetical protein
MGRFGSEYPIPKTSAVTKAKGLQLLGLGPENVPRLNLKSFPPFYAGRARLGDLQNVKHRIWNNTFDASCLHAQPQNKSDQRVCSHLTSAPYLSKKCHIAVGKTLTYRRPHCNSRLDHGIPILARRGSSMSASIQCQGLHWPKTWSIFGFRVCFSMFPRL